MVDMAMGDTLVATATQPIARPSAWPSTQPAMVIVVAG